MDKLTVESVRAEVARIIAAGDGDPEASHGSEDRLLWAIVGAAANGHPQAREMAHAIQPLADADLVRWYC
jgi:hypothetical protein